MITEDFPVFLGAESSVIMMSRKGGLACPAHCRGHVRRC